MVLLAVVICVGPPVRNVKSRQLQKEQADNLKSRQFQKSLNFDEAKAKSRSRPLGLGQGRHG